MDIMAVVDKMLAGDQAMLAKVITRIEREDGVVPEIMKRIYPRAGKAYTIGVTGPPGGGKSTLVDKLVSLLRQKDFTVGVVAVDPTSPFSGGAILGDRIRMQRHYLDEGVFIRSMASRGSFGGLAMATKDVVTALDAFGKDFVIVETVGVGQTELDIINRVDTTLVILIPGAGDAIQTMKAGLMEIADIFVVNKADQPGTENTINDLESMLSLHPAASGWDVPVISTQAHNNIGIEDLFQQIERHRTFLTERGQLNARREQRRKNDFLMAIQDRAKRQLQKHIERDGELSAIMERVARGELDPHSGAIEVFNTLGLLNE